VDAARDGGGAAARGADAAGAGGAWLDNVAAAIMSSTETSSPGAAPFDNTE